MAGSVFDVLKQSDVFSRLPELELRKIGKVFKARRIGRNQPLFRQGDAGDSLFLVQTGRIRISSADQAGHERVIAFAGAGELVGEMGLLSGEPRPATAMATTEARVLQLRKADFDIVAGTNVELMRDLARVVDRRREASMQRALDEAGGGAGYRHGLVSTVFSPRGGAGTTTVATNLAVALAQNTPDQVVLVDLNVYFSHVPLLLNLTPRTSLSAISAVSLAQMDRENLEFYLTTHAESSLRVLPTVLRPEDAEQVNPEQVRAAVELLRRYFVHVIVDLGRGFSELNLTAIDAAHNILVICTPERLCLRGMVESQRILRELVRTRADPLYYVVNHASPYSGFTLDELEAALAMRVAGVIPFGGDLPSRAALEGQPLITRSPGTTISKSILGLAARLEQQLVEARAVMPTFA